MRLPFLGLLLVITPAVIKAQVSVVDTAMVGYQAYTVCSNDGAFRVYVNPNLSPDQRRAALVHEMAHVGQILSLGCAVAESTYTASPEFRLRAELDAYCAEARAQILDGLPVTNPMPDNGPFPLYMFVSYGMAFASLDSVRTIVRNRCPELAG